MNKVKREEREKRIKILNHMPFGVHIVPNCESIFQYCKNLTHLTHLIKLRLLCLVCQMYRTIAFSTYATVVVDALNILNALMIFLVSAVDKRSHQRQTEGATRETNKKLKRHGFGTETGSEPRTEKRLGDEPVGDILTSQS